MTVMQARLGLAAAFLSLTAAGPVSAEQFAGLSVQIGAPQDTFRARHGSPRDTAAVAFPRRIVATAAIGLADVETGRATTPETADAGGRHRQDLRRAVGAGGEKGEAAIAGGPARRAPRRPAVVRRAAERGQHILRSPAAPALGATGPSSPARVPGRANPHCGRRRHPQPGGGAGHCRGPRAALRDRHRMGLQRHGVHPAGNGD